MSAFVVTACQSIQILLAQSYQTHMEQLEPPFWFLGNRFNVSLMHMYCMYCVYTVHTCWCLYTLSLQQNDTTCPCFSFSRAMNNFSHSGNVLPDNHASCSGGHLCDMVGQALAEKCAPWCQSCTEHRECYPWAPLGAWHNHFLISWWPPETFDLWDWQM